MGAKEKGPLAADAQNPAPPAWEDPALSFSSRFLGTVRAVLFEPRKLFATLGAEDSGRVNLYVYLCALLGLGISTAWQFAELRWAGPELDDLLRQLSAQGQVELTRAQLQAFSWWSLLATPLVALFPAHIFAAVYHFGLWLFGVGHRSYDLTFRIVAYGFTPLLLTPIPVVGPLAAIVWSAGLHVYGVRRAYGLPFGLAMVVVLLPGFMCFCTGWRFLAELVLASLGIQPA